MGLNYDKMLGVDRRWIYLLIFIAIAIPTLFPLRLPVQVTSDVRGVFDEIEALPDGSHIFIAVDYEPGTRPEMDPMSTAVLLHCFMKKLKVVSISYVVYGAGVAEHLFKETERLYTEQTGEELVYGEDYCYLGFKPGEYAMIIKLGQDIKETCKQDGYNIDVYTLPILKEKNKLGDYPYMVNLHDDSYADMWILYGHERTGLKMGSVCTAVMASGMYPFIQAGQLTGVVGGLKGGSEYEQLLNEKYDLKKPLVKATAGMDIQSVIHILIILLMLLGNFAYIMKSRQEKKQS